MSSGDCGGVTRGNVNRSGIVYSLSAVETCMKGSSSWHTHYQRREFAQENHSDGFHLETKDDSALSPALTRFCGSYAKILDKRS
jgi:hypothetical protein